MLSVTNVGKRATGSAAAKLAGHVMRPRAIEIGNDDTGYLARAGQIPHHRPAHQPSP
jgi:hypothetical protein